MPGTDANRLFQNYAKITPRIPAFVWWGLRLAVLGATGAVIVLLLTEPALGLKLFWGLAILLVPALLVTAPGLWRQVCPMALLNQIPRQTGISLARELPARLRDNAFAIAVALFLVAVALRVPVLNHEGALVAAGLALVLALAFLGGLVFKGRSGWCGTFCPLGPIQRNYGHAPLLVVRNGYCESCVGCQKNCYDFNPRAAVFGDVYDDDPRYAGQRRFFFAMMPGLNLAYFLQGPAPAYGEPLHGVILVLGACASVGLYQAVTSFFSLNPFRAANAFAVLAVAIFYYFNGPALAATIGDLLRVGVPPEVSLASSGLGVALAGILLVQGLRNERVLHAAAEDAQRAHIDTGGRSLKERLDAASGPKVTEASSGASFQVAPNQTLLEAMEAAKVKINFGCRSGLCGADPVLVREGAGNLAPAGADETATLRRLGLEGRARLACVCQVTGPAVIDTNLAGAPPAAQDESADAAVEDRAATLGIAKVVVVGNGVAGLGVAEALRRASPSVEIVVVTEEPHHFYNRMAIGRVIYGRTSMDGLFLLPDSWYVEKRIEVWRNTIATAIDRPTKTLTLGTGETLAYDRLVLATGARAASPGTGYAERPNAFMLRTAADAQAIRSTIQALGARTAVVIGGGVLGVEAAVALHHLGLAVTILQRSGRLMDRQLDAEGAAMLTRYLENIGIAVRTGAVVKAFEGNGRIERITLADGGAVEGDIFVASTGIVANTALAAASGLDVGRGIKVDRLMRTTDPDIFAVGDVAELPGALGGLWPTGAAQASTAVEAMLGTETPYETPRILLQLKCDGVDLRSFGDPEPRADDASMTADPEAGVWWRLVVRDGVLAGAVFVGPPGTARAFTTLMKDGADLAALSACLEKSRRAVEA